MNQILRQYINITQIILKNVVKKIQKHILGDAIPFMYVHCFMPKKREKPALAFHTTLFQPEHLNIKLNTGELLSLLTLNDCKWTSSASSSTLK